eukprot:TRINITY_DN14561_c0_g1_i2.p1 TRINITY_DN14561_c0_g1~~TRINITY_DN14561_c0_g1_i2.p1  ORF type:complete len:665 (+),score=149.16 TRINITY_DN14561_c0_g1_i2:208-2202(+)
MVGAPPRIQLVVEFLPTNYGQPGQSLCDIDLVAWHDLESCSAELSCTAIPTRLPSLLTSPVPNLNWLISIVCRDGQVGPAALYVLPVLFDLLSEANQAEDHSTVDLHCSELLRVMAEIAVASACTVVAEGAGHSHDAAAAQSELLIEAIRRKEQRLVEFVKSSQASIKEVCAVLLIAAAAIPTMFSKLGSLRKSSLIAHPELQFCLVMASTAVQGQPPKLPSGARNEHWLVLIAQWLALSESDDQLPTLLPSTIEHPDECSEAWVLSQMLPGFAMLMTLHRRRRHCEAAAELLGSLVRSPWLHFGTRRLLIPTMLSLSFRISASDIETCSSLPSAAASLLTGRSKRFIEYLANQPFAWEDADITRRMQRFLRQMGVPDTRKRLAKAIGGAQELWTWGCGKHGRLGHGDQENQDVPKKVEHFVVGSRVRCLGSGAYSTAIVTQMGDLFVIGRENQSPTEQGLYLPRHIPELRQVRAVACGYGRHLAVLTEQHHLYTWGRGNHGQLGFPLSDEYEEYVRDPTRLGCFDGKRLGMVAVGESHTAVVTETGQVYTFGCSLYGQLGHGDCVNRSEPSRVEALSGLQIASASLGPQGSIFVTTTGQVLACGASYDDSMSIEDVPVPVAAFEGFTVTQVACGVYHVLALLQDGRVVRWGCLLYTSPSPRDS